MSVVVDELDLSSLRQEVEDLREESAAHAARRHELEGALEFVTRFACTKPDLSASECLGAIAHHPTIKAVLDKWLSAEPAPRHWKVRQFKPPA